MSISPDGVCLPLASHPENRLPSPYLASRRVATGELLAVGNQQFVERVSGVYEARKKFVDTETDIATDLSTWTIHEESLPYNAFSGVK